MKYRLFILLTAALWSTGGICIKVLHHRYGLPPEVVACLRSAVAGLVLAWALPGLRGAPVKMTAAAAFFFTLTVATFVFSSVRTTAANAIFLEYIFPLLVAIGAVAFYREKPGATTIIGVAIGTAAVGLIVAGSWQPDAQSGLVYGLICGVATAGLVLVQHRMAGGSPLALVSLYNLIAAACLLPLAWGKFHVPPTAWGILLALGVFQIAVPYALFITALRRVPAAEASLIALAEPVLNPVWVWLFLGEEPGRWTLLGGAALQAALVVHFLGLLLRRTSAAT